MGVRKKPRTKKQAEQGRLTGRARPSGKTGGPDRRPPDQKVAARTLMGFRMRGNDWRDWKKN